MAAAAAAAAIRLATWPIRAMSESWASPFPKPKPKKTNSKAFQLCLVFIDPKLPIG
jgi:hypothetical protein